MAAPLAQLGLACGFFGLQGFSVWCVLNLRFQGFRVYGFRVWVKLV